MKHTKAVRLIAVAAGLVAAVALAVVLAGRSLAAPSGGLTVIPLGQVYVNTSVIRVLDAEENVVCYVLAPERVAHQFWTPTQVAVAANSGAISCVRREIGVPAPAAGAKGARPAPR